MPPAPDVPTFRHPFSPHSRILRATVAAVLLVLTIRLLWGWQAHRALESRLADLRRQHQPVTTDDVPFERLPDKNNAWLVQQSAAAALVSGVDPPAASNLEYRGYPPYPPEWWRMAEASEKAHGKAFALARQSRTLDRAQIHTGRLTSPVAVSAMSPAFSTARQLALTLADGALYAHMTGKDPEALDRAADALHLADSLRQDHFLISQLVATAIDAVACERLKVVAPGLRLAPTDPSAAATRDRARDLITRLLDERDIWEGATESLKLEQLVAIDSVRYTAEANWFIRPLADRQILRDLHNLQLGILASTYHTKPQVAATLIQLKVESNGASFRGLFTGGPSPIPRYSRWFFNGSGEYVDRYLETSFRLLADRRATAVSLAAQLYRADHAGAWPAKLEDLVPEYLPALPADPYHDDNRPLGYTIKHVPGGAERPLVFFDAGPVDVLPDPPEPWYDWRQDPREGKHDDIRQYRDLSRFPGPPPSTKPVDDNPDVTY